MAIFNSYVKLPEGRIRDIIPFYGRKIQVSELWSFAQILIAGEGNSKSLSEHDHGIPWPFFWIYLLKMGWWIP